MDHIISIRAVQKKMKHKPKGQRLYHYFLGVPNQLSEAEAAEVKKIIESENNKTIKFLDKVKTA